jgi:hypothetical protein
MSKDTVGSKAFEFTLTMSKNLLLENAGQINSHVRLWKSVT